jgi:hypothetical protein
MSLLANLKELSSEADKLQHITADEMHNDNTKSPFEKMMIFWKFIRVGLMLTKFIVGNTADKVIDEVIKYGDLLQANQSS